jgi:hypothetical protein
VKRRPLPIYFDARHDSGPPVENLIAGRRHDCRFVAECCSEMSELGAGRGRLVVGGWRCHRACAAYAPMSAEERRADLDGLGSLAMAIFSHTPEAQRTSRLAEKRAARRAREEALDERDIPRVLPKWMRRAG